MSGSSQGSEDRTEAASQRHLDQARESGNVPLSREASTFAGLAAVLVVMVYGGPLAVQALSRQVTIFLARADQSILAGPAAFHIASAGFLTAIIPPLGAATFAGAAAVLVQTNFLLHLGALQPKFSRISPMAGLKRVFGANGLIEMVKSFGKLGLIVFALWLAVIGDIGRLLVQPGQDPGSLPAALARSVMHILTAGLCAQAVIAGIDLFWVRQRYARQMRMSKQDLRDEHKETEGNPHIKARIRRIRMIRARRRMMAAVPTATVVVTNPTHYAIALAYDRSKNAAPRIVAKGIDTVAARIREIARTNNVPIVANPPLARALYEQQIDTDIAAEHFKAVAGIIAYVWRLRQPARPR